MLYQVYALTSRYDGSIRYVGVTICSLEHRLKQHMHLAKKGGELPVSDWIRNEHYTIQIKLLRKVETKEEMLSWERKYISKYKGLLNTISNNTKHLRISNKLINGVVIRCKPPTVKKLTFRWPNT